MKTSSTRQLNFVPNPLPIGLQALEKKPRKNRSSILLFFILTLLLLYVLYL